MRGLRACPVCAGEDIYHFLERRGVPVHQNLLATSQAAARAARKGDLDMSMCTRCGFVFNAAFDLGLMSYDARYDNTQTCSGEFDTYVNDRIEYLIGERGIRGATVVEVGCGKGDFIRRLVEFPESRISGIGFDPTYVGPDVLCDGRLRFERRFYDEHAASVAADVVVCRHVIEHVPDPLLLLRAVRAAIEARPDALICFETPDVAWILENRVSWDFFYEHCSLFTPESLSGAFSRAGFAVESVGRSFGGQYMWLEARRGVETRESSDSATPLLSLAREFAASVSETEAKWKSILSDFRASSFGSAARVGVWGAGAKGVTFANLADPTATNIHCFIEVNPAKQGKFIPGTGHRVIAPEQIDAEGLDGVLVLNPNYVREMTKYLQDRSSRAVVVDLMAATA